MKTSPAMQRTGQTARRARSLVNSAWYSLGQAEAAWDRFVHRAEALGDAEVVAEAQKIAQQMHVLWEELKP
jgi:hypothetical protein